jgi:hypothetical protein
MTARCAETRTWIFYVRMSHPDGVIIFGIGGDGAAYQSEDEAMDRAIFAFTALAITTAVAPSGAQAQDAKQVEAEPNADRSKLASAPFSFRLVEKAATIKARSISHDWQDGSLTLNIMRAKSQRRRDDLPSTNFNRYSVMATDIGMVQEVSGRDSVSFGLSYALENRRPSINISAHNIYRTSNVAATLGWTHDSKFRLATSLFATKPTNTRSTPERLVEIAGGAPFSTQGVSLTASFSPTSDPAKSSYGIDIRSQKMSQSDATLFGAPSGRSDPRVGIFLHKAF